MHPLVLLCLASHAFAVPLDEPKLSRLLGFTGKALVNPPPDLPQTPLPFRLLGTLRSKDGAWSLAALECGSKSTTVSIGDVVLGVEIVTIDQQELTVRREGRLERVGRAAPTTSRPTAVPRVTRKQLDDTMRDPRQVLREVQLLPAMEGGRQAGFRANFVKEGSVVSALGLKTGDVLRSVNGISLDNPERLLGLYSSLQRARRFDVELERDGARITKSVELDP